MSQMSDYLENKLIDHIFRTTTWTRPSTLYVGLYTTAPSDSGGGTEVSGNNYGRAAVTVGNSYWQGTHGTHTGDSSGTGGQTSNGQDISFTVASPSAWGTIVAFAICDSVTTGNILIWGSLSTAKTVNALDPAPKFSANQLTVTFA